MLFLITLLGFATCLTVVFVTDRARTNMQARRHRGEEAMLSPPSGQPAGVPSPPLLTPR